MANNAAALTVENPDTDPVSVAHSAAEYHASRVDESDDEIARMEANVDIAREHLAGAKQSLADSKALQVERKKIAADAAATLEAAEAADPELAKSIAANRELTRKQMIAGASALTPEE